jgi:NAD(P)-dependent dehydrogenase (short-subunit alcohol dehydrogenase family)
MAENLFSLKGKNAVVIGGAGGLGRVLAAGFAEYGAQVAIADINEDGLRSAAEEIKGKTGQTVKTYSVNTDQEETIQELVKKTVADMGRVHVLVNAQGFNIKSGATEFPVEAWDKLFSVNVRGVMLCCKNFAAHMVEQGGGKIINLSSIRGLRAAAGGNMGYCATKGAVDMITRTLAVELATKNVLVNALGPIITATPMTKETIKNNPERYAKTLNNIPMGRFGEPEDLIGPAVFLASAASDFVTGTILYPDGGTMAFA